MSESEAAVDRRGNDAGDDCPICLEPLPSFWDVNRRSINVCCGKRICLGCSDDEVEFLRRAAINGSFGKEEDQLDRFCPFCRTRKPLNVDCAEKMMLDKFKEGCLPLHLHRELALIYLNGEGGVDVDVERGMEILMLGAEKGDPECQFRIGSVYWDGEYGMAQSNEEAKRWLLAATEQGHAVAECELAFMSKDEGNYAEFLRYLRSSASKGHSDACYFLGKASYDGTHGLQKSTKEALHALTPAAERGHHPASMSLLGFVLCCPSIDRVEPPRFNPNFTKGMHWMRRAAETGDEAAVKQMRHMEEVASGWCFMCNKEASQEKPFLRCSRCRGRGTAARTARCSTGRQKKGGTSTVASNGDHFNVLNEDICCGLEKQGGRRRPQTGLHPIVSSEMRAFLISAGRQYTLRKH